ncbi:MAG: DUF2235 domain-containing protein [Hydrogenophaga sp.]|nr:DUF2235 domain-containing protein [Hydrogenophaga sp.]
MTDSTVPSATEPAARSEPRAAREDVLSEVRRADEQWATKPGRNLVLLFDGSGNILGNSRDTNVVKLMRLLEKDSPDDRVRPAQLVYYDPGVGTANAFPAAGWWGRLAERARRLKALALGTGAFENIAEAYEFLARHYEVGDRIYLLGFSRGAFTARSVSGMVNMYGLVQTPGLAVLGSLVRTYFAEPGPARTRFANDVVEHFSLHRRPLLHFIGVWDTVETIGSGVLGGLRITNSPDVAGKRFVHVRHAVALHETRVKYAPRLYRAPDFSADEQAHRSFDQRWFRGAHSDIGGAYREDGLSQITLAWMAREAEEHGLLLAQPPAGRPDSTQPLHDQTLECPFWAWTGLDTRPRTTGDPVHSDVVDASARPVAQATPARASPAARRRSVLGWLLGLAVLVLLGFTALADAQVCSLRGAPGWVAWVPSAAQLLAPWHADLGIVCDSGRLGQALALDAWLLPLYAVWLAWPVAWALRRQAARAVPKGRRLPWLSRHAHRAMLALVLFDLAENLGSQHLESGGLVVAAAVSVFSAGKLLALAALLWVWLGGVFSRRP